MNNTKKIHLLHFQAELFSSNIYRWVLRSLVHFLSGSSSALGMTRENHFCMILRSFYSFSPLLDEITAIIGTKLKKFFCLFQAGYMTKYFLSWCLLLWAVNQLVYVIVPQLAARASTVLGRPCSRHKMHFSNILFSCSTCCVTDNLSIFLFAEQKVTINVQFIKNCVKKAS